jgi:hypothetical protein
VVSRGLFMFQTFHADARIDLGVSGASVTDRQVTFCS